MFQQPQTDLKWDEDVYRCLQVIDKIGLIGSNSDKLELSEGKGFKHIVCSEALAIRKSWCIDGETVPKPFHIFSIRSVFGNIGCQ